MVEMKAVDTLHVSNAGPDNIPPGGKFEVNDDEARQLEERGLAKRLKGAPANKVVEAAPENKIIGAAALKQPDRPVLKPKGK